MRAVLMEKGELWVENIPDPVPQAGEVLVKTAACGICGSDLHAARHTDDFVKTSREAGGAFLLTSFDPVVLGHEFCAEIVDFGPKTERSLSVGGLVCSIPVLLRDRNLSVGYSPETPGGFGEYMVLSERMLKPVPSGTPAKVAALTEPMAVGLHAVNKAGLNGTEAIIVLGAGPVGLAVITALQHHSGPVIAADFSTGRRQFAANQGADVVIDPRQQSPFLKSEVKDRDLVVFECVGVPGVMDDIFMQSPPNTHVVVVGVCLQTDHIRPLIAINKELSLQFVLGYSVAEFQQSLQFIAEGKFDVAGLVSHEIGLDEVADTFVALRDPEVYAKVVINPSL